MAFIEPMHRNKTNITYLLHIIYLDNHITDTILISRKIWDGSTFKKLIWYYAMQLMNYARLFVAF